MSRLPEPSLREQAEGIARHPDAIDWIEGKLREALIAKRQRLDMEMKGLLESKGWKVFRLGQSWAVGLSETHAAGKLYAWAEDGSVVGAALRFVEALRGEALRLEKDIVS